MFVKHLQEYLDQFTDGKKGNAISNARIYIDVNGHLEEINKSHQKLNGELQTRVKRLEKLLEDYDYKNVC